MTLNGVSVVPRGHYKPERDRKTEMLSVKMTREMMDGVQRVADACGCRTTDVVRDALALYLRVMACHTPEPRQVRS